MGTMESTLDMPLNGISVRTLRYDRIKARMVAKVADPRIKYKVFIRMAINSGFEYTSIYLERVK